MNSTIRCIILFLTVLQFSCTSRTDSLRQFVENEGYDYTVFRSILVITENGCPQCDKLFANLMSQQQENPQMLYIIAARGTMVDISGLFDFKNVIKDYHNNFRGLQLTDKSSCIFLTEEGEIDTLIEIEVRSLQSSLDYINNRLGN